MNTKFFALMRVSPIFTDCPNIFLIHANPYLSPREIEIRAAHEIMAARTTQLALLIDQLMPALRTPAPMLAGDTFVGRCGANLI
jgi:hypothetical protein